VLSGAVIERGSVIAAGALVTEGTRVPAGSLAMGVPARIVRSVDDALRRRIEHTWRNYVRLAREHRAGRYAPPGAPAASR
jgi:carbonic anhydrase/acetyltransferase-like protein (isoleucine patch superfamily)